MLRFRSCWRRTGHTKATMSCKVFHSIPFWKVTSSWVYFCLFAVFSIGNTEKLGIGWGRGEGVRERERQRDEKLRIRQRKQVAGCSCSISVGNTENLLLLQTL